MSSEFEDEFTKYTKGSRTLHISEKNSFMIVWGETTEKTVNLLGLSFDSRYLWDEYRDKGDMEKLKALINLSNKLDLPIFWVGKEEFDENQLELGVLPNAIDKFDPNLYDLAKAREEIQDILGSSYESDGTSKDVNVRLANGYHKWTRDNLPSKYTKIDIDILTVDDENNPTGFVEIKRSYSPESWTPYKDDFINYVLQFRTSDKADLTPIIVQHEKQSINDDSTIGYYVIKNINTDDPDWMDYDKTLISASEAKEKIEEL